MKRSTIFLILMGLLIAFTATFVGAAYRVYRLTKPSVVVLKNNLKIDQSQGEVTFLLAGIDDVDRVHRSDTIMLVRIDLDNKRIKAMSIPRDTRVTLKKHGNQKINAAYAYGGIDLLKETVVNLTGAPVNYSVVVSYTAFPKLIDAIGGVDIDVPKRMVYTDKAQKLYINFKPGMQHLNGEDSLKYVRFRHDALGDEGRMKRQQQFVNSVMEKLKSPSIALKIPEIATTMTEIFKTDLPSETAVQLGLYLKDVDNRDIELFTMPGKAAYIDKLSYWIADLPAAQQKFNTWPPLRKEEPATDPSQAQTEEQLTATKEKGQSKVHQPATQSVQASIQDGKQNGSERNDEELIAENPNEKNEDRPIEQLSPKELLDQFGNGLSVPLAILNGTGEKGLSKNAAVRMEKLGITVDYQGNAKHYDYHYSLIYYPKGQKQTAKLLANLCQIPQNLVIEKNSSNKLALVLGKDNQRILDILDSFIQQ